MSTKWRKLIARLLVILFASAGFFFQLITISSSYFAYKTVTRSDRSLPNKYAAPNLAICFPFKEIINPKLYFQLKGHPYVKLQSIDPFEKFAQFPNVTVGEIFHLTPPIDGNLFNICMSQVPNSYETISASRGSCLRDVFNVSKFYTQEFICYNFRPRFTSEYSFNRLAHSLTSGGLIYGLMLNCTTFSSANRAKLILYEGGLPHTSKSCAPTVNRQVQGDQSIKGNNDFSYIVLTSSMTMIHRLPLPYQSGCNAGHNFNQNECKRNCLIESLANLSKLPFSVIIDDSIINSANKFNLNHTFVNLIDLQNATVNSQLLRSEEKCTFKCAGLTCHTSYSSTEALPTDGQAFAQMTFAVYAPRKSNVIIHTEPYMPVDEFLVLVLSCLGVWFGFSFLSLDPEQLAVRAKLLFPKVKTSILSVGQRQNIRTIGTIGERRFHPHLSRFHQQRHESLRNLNSPSINTQFHNVTSTNESTWKKIDSSHINCFKNSWM